MPVEGAKELRRKLIAAKRALRDAPRIAGTRYVNNAIQAFCEQGHTDIVRTPWRPRAAPDKDKGRHILVKSGDLRKSIRIVAIGPNWVRVGTDVRYAKVHNEGGRIKAVFRVPEHTRKGSTVRKHVRRVDHKMPERPFLKRSRRAELQIRRDVLRRVFGT